MIRRLKKKLKALTHDDPHMREVARGAILAFAIKMVGAGLGFAFNVVLARLLGAEGIGIYFLAFSVMSIGSVIGRLGLDNTLLRFTATHAARMEWAEVCGAHQLGIRMAIIASGILSILGFLLSPWMATTLFGKPELAEPMRWMCLSILPFALLNLQAESLKGIKKIRDAMLLQGVGIPLFGLILIWPLAGYAGVAGAAWAYLVATMLVMLLGTWAWRRAVVGFAVDGLARYPFARLWASCKPLLVTTLMNRAVMPWAPIFILGIWATESEVGIYAAASRVALLVNFMLLAVNNVLAPKLAELYAKGEMDALGQTARRAAILVTLLASPVFLILIFGGRWVMGMFGPEFVQGAVFLAILAIGQFVNTFTGAVNHILNITGNELIVRNTTLFVSAGLVVACVLTIPWLGAVGAAISASAAVIAVNLYAASIVWKRIGIMTIPFMGRKK